MGNCIASKISGGSPAPDENNDSGAAPIHSGAETHVLIVCVDYTGTPDELTATEDGKNLSDLLDVCGVTDITKLYNNQGTKPLVTQAIKEIGARCKPGDFFIFFYSGHGGQLPDEDGDEDDGFDETLCLVTETGKFTGKGSSMTDDEFSAAFTQSVGDEVNVIVLADCCHSGSIADFDKPIWRSIKGVSLSGCLDTQTSTDITGEGGVFTHSFLMAVSRNSIIGKDDYSVAQMYNGTIEYNKKTEALESDQDITMSCSSGCGGAENMAWPLIPLKPYASPKHKQNLALKLQFQTSNLKAQVKGKK